MTPLERFLVMNGIAVAGVVAAMASFWLPRQQGIAALFAALPALGIVLAEAFC